MTVKFSPQLRNLWKVGIIAISWGLWSARNDCVFNDTVASSYRVLAQVIVAFREANAIHSLGAMHNSNADLFTLHALEVKGNPAVPKQCFQVTWWPPLIGWTKVNTDGSALGCPGVIHAGGVFRDAANKVLGCFHVNGGVGFAFEAELLAAIVAIEMASVNGWNKLWLEADSAYVVEILESRSSKVPWRFSSRWGKVLDILDKMDFRTSHIYREGNAVADLLASPSTPEGWWYHSIPIIEEAVKRDAFSPRFYRWK